MGGTVHATRCGRDHAGPTWCLLYVIAALLVGTVGLVEVLVDGEGTCKVLEALAVTAGFGLMVVWRRCNRIALELEQGRRRT
jgi:hypothetical protein